MLKLTFTFYNTTQCLVSVSKKLSENIETFKQVKMDRKLKNVYSGLVNTQIFVSYKSVLLYILLSITVKTG